MNCSNCQSYNKGRGKPECLKCKQYIEIIKNSGKRKTVKFETFPSIILENIADNRTDDIFAILKVIRLDLSIPVMAYYLLGTKQSELSEYLKLDQASVCRKIQEGIDTIKDIMQGKAPG